MNILRVNLLGLLSICALTLLPLSVFADDTDTALMINENCTRCHAEEVYTRADRKINSLAALGKQVRMCNVNTGANWFDDEVDLVINYLNQHYYQFN